MGFVTSGAGLFEADSFALAFRADDDGLQAEKIAILAFVVERFDAHVRLAFVDGDFGGEVGVLDAAQTPLGGLRPELAILIPAEPILRPTSFGVGSERDRPAKAVLPMRENRVAFVGDERDFGAGFRRGADVAAQLRIFLSADAAHDFAASYE